MALLWSCSLPALLLLACACLNCESSLGEELYQTAETIDPNSSKMGGNDFFLGFMRNEGLEADSTAHIALFITTEENEASFVMETKLPGLPKFVETSDTGLYSRHEVARKGGFTIIHFSEGAISDVIVKKKNDRNKAVRVRAINPDHKLTIYALNEERASTDGYMAISCVSAPTEVYRYFVFSAGFAGKNLAPRFSQFMIVPCENDTAISIEGSQPIKSPLDLNPSVYITDPDSVLQVQRIVTFKRHLNQFETVMIDSPNDLTGTIITSNRPISVFVGHQCGQVPTRAIGCDYLVEQVPPHTTYGTLFFTSPFALRKSGDRYTIGSITDGVSVTVTCTQEVTSIVNTSSFILNHGEFHYIDTRPGPYHDFCSIRSKHPVTVMGYTLGSNLDKIRSPNQQAYLGDPSMVYIPPVLSYLNNYTVTSIQNLASGYSSYISLVLPAQTFSNSEADRNKLRVNGDILVPESGYQPIYCSVDGENKICAYGAYFQIFDVMATIDYGDGMEPLYLYVYGYSESQSFAYPTPFNMNPIGLAWIQGEDMIVLETAGNVTLPLFRSFGDISLASRAFVCTRSTHSGQAIDGSDFTGVYLQSVSNLRYSQNQNLPDTNFTVEILNDDIAEPVEYLEVVLTCDGKSNCYFQRSVYTITIVDEQGQCEDLETEVNGITVDYNFERMPLRPYGTVATYNCPFGSALMEVPTRTCVNGIWKTTKPEVICPSQNVITIMFKESNYTFVENEVVGNVDVITDRPTFTSFDVQISGGPSEQEDILKSTSAISESKTFPAGATSITFSFALTDDSTGLEGMETFTVSLYLLGSPSGIQIGSILQTTVLVKDDDVVEAGFTDTAVYVSENDMLATVTIMLSRQAVCNVTLHIETLQGTAIENEDYLPLNITRIILAGETKINVSVEIVNDVFAREGSETFQLVIMSLVPAGIVLTQQSSQIWILDDDEGACQALPDATNGEITYSGEGLHEFPHSTIAIYSCNHGYILEGVSSRICEVPAGSSYGEFNGSEPHCIPARCQPLSDITNGEITYSSEGLEDLSDSTIAIHSCNHGYVLEGNSTRVCEVPGGSSYGEFNGNDPHCIPARCQPLSDITNGEITYSNEGLEDLSDSTIAIHSCNHGYVMEGKSTRICEVPAGSPYGEFNGREPHCIPARCQPLTDVGNGEITYSSGGLTDLYDGTIAIYSCYHGYILEGVSSRMCEVPAGSSYGEFNGSEPHCIPARCQPLADITNGEITYSSEGLEDLSDSTIAIYSCNQGYVLDGNSTRFCEVPAGSSYGEFNGNEPHCIPARCQPLSYITNGEITYSSEGLEDLSDSTIVIYSCNHGYVLDGKSTRICEVPTGSSYGEFNGREPHCSPVYCQPLTDITNGEITYSSEELENISDGIIAIYSCNHGYVLEGNSTRVCEVPAGSSYGEFYGNEPHCIPARCQPLSDITNGEITYSSEGLEDLSDSTTAIYSCNHGYALDGKSTRICEVPAGSSFGEFNGREPRCIPAYCQPLSDITNGEINYSNEGQDLSDSTIAIYSCNHGYILDGKSTRICDVPAGSSYGEFNGSKPRCIPARCQPLTDVANGEINYSSEGLESFSDSTIAIYSCNHGYALVGNYTRICEVPAASSYGEFNGNAPRCIPGCHELESIGNGMISYSTDHFGLQYEGTSVGKSLYGLGTMATYNCNVHFELNTDQGNIILRTCKDGGDGIGGVFYGVSPSCEALFCQPFSNQVNGVISYIHMEIEYGIGAVARFHCNTDTFSVGTTTSTCVVGKEKKREWTNDLDPCFSLYQIGQLVKEDVTEDNYDRFIAFVSAFVDLSLEKVDLQTSENVNNIALILKRAANVAMLPHVNVSSVVVEDLVSSLDGLQEWKVDVLKSEDTPSIVKSFEGIATKFAEGEELNISLTNVIFRSERIPTLGITGDFNTSATTGGDTFATLPRNLFRDIHCRHGKEYVGVVYTEYLRPHLLFPVNDSNNISGKAQAIGTSVMGINVGRDLDLVDLHPPVKISFQLRSPNNVSRGSVKCVSWNFSSNSWTDYGCTTERKGVTITCQCTHLTNFAVLVDICTRTQECTTNPVVQEVLTVITYIGVIFSCVGLIITVITQLAFKKIRENDSTIYNVQLSIAIFCMLVTFAAGIEQVQLYAGCIIASGLIHYFTLVSVMWMGAEAQLMFQKLVLVFQRVTKRIKIAISLVCWLLPLMVVLIPLIIEVSNGVEPDNDLIITRHINETAGTIHGFCFIKNSVIFFVAFLGPIFIIMLFNLFVFFLVIFILIRHSRQRSQRSKEPIKGRDIFRRLVSVCGIMFLFGLTWLFAALTININGNQVLRLIFQSLFVVTASFQGFFIFLFFCVLKKEARDVWKEFLTCGRYKSKPYSYYISSSRMTPRGSLSKDKYKCSPELSNKRSGSLCHNLPTSNTYSMPISLMEKPSEEDIRTETPLTCVKGERSSDSGSSIEGFSMEDTVVQEKSMENVSVKNESMEDVDVKEKSMEDVMEKSMEDIP